jgi:predicted Rossmann fold flavoprotein
MQGQQYHIVVIGGGASGLLAAIAAKREQKSGCSIAILERNDRIGRKILSTGNGRCNLGNTGQAKGKYHGSMTEKALAILEQAPEITAYFREMGLICREDSEGRLYPYSNHASAVLDTLRLQIEQLQIDVICDCCVATMQKIEDGFSLQTSKGVYTAEQVIFSCGGYAAPALGTDGTAFSMLGPLAIAPTACTPALCALKTNPSLVRSLKGIRLSADTTLYRNRKPVKTERGEVQFTEQALSGICIFNLSTVCHIQEGSTYEIRLDLLPDWKQEQVLSYLWEVYSMRYDAPVAMLLTGLFHKRVALQILKQCGISQKEERTVMTCTPQEITQIANCLKDWRFPVTGKGDWKTAQVTDGGIPSGEVQDTLESVRYKGLYFTGEALDLHGDCGGYNLNWAWASGWYAGIHAAKKWNDKYDKDK